MKKRTPKSPFPAEVLAQVQVLLETCEKHGVECLSVLNKETRQRRDTEAYGHKLSCCGYFNASNLIAQACDHQHGDGTLKKHCLANQSAPLPQAIGIGRVFN